MGVRLLLWQVAVYFGWRLAEGSSGRGVMRRQEDSRSSKKYRFCKIGLGLYEIVIDIFATVKHSQVSFVVT